MATQPPPDAPTFSLPSLPMRMPLLVLLLVSTALAATPQRAGAEIIDIDWGSGHRFERSLRVAPGKFAEVCGKVATGNVVRWRFEADGPLEFNIHYHEGRAVHYPVKREGTARADGTLTSVQERDYCWMWTNKTDKAAALGVSLER